LVNVTLQIHSKKILQITSHTSSAHATATSHSAAESAEISGATSETSIVASVEVVITSKA
jgi:hypothetical protein